MDSFEAEFCQHRPQHAGECRIVEQSRGQQRHTYTVCNGDGDIRHRAATQGDPQWDFDRALR